MLSIAALTRPSLYPCSTSQPPVITSTVGHPAAHRGVEEAGTQPWLRLARLLVTLNPSVDSLRIRLTEQYCDVTPRLILLDAALLHFQKAYSPTVRSLCTLVKSRRSSAIVGVMREPISARYRAVTWATAIAHTAPVLTDFT